MSSAPSERKSNVHPVFGAVLRDGRIVEAVLSIEGDRTELLQYSGGLISRSSKVDVPRLGTFVPYAPTNNLLTHRVVLLPSEATDYTSDSELLRNVRAFIHRYADVSDSFEEIASYYVLLTWIFDSFSEIPYLRFRGDFGSGKSRCLLTLGSLCYRPMFASGASTVSPLFRITDSCRGTLVIDESDFRYSDEKSEVVKILNNGSASGFPVLRSEATPQKEFNPTAFDVFGPKIIATRGAFEDPALESRCITEVMSGLPPRADIELSLPKHFHSDALALRNQLLMYRFRNRGMERDLNAVRQPAIEARVAQVFGPLISLAQDSEALDRMLSLAREKSATVVAERSATLEAQLIGIIFTMRCEHAALAMKDIAIKFADEFGSDYSRPISPRWIGAQLRKRLSLVPIKSHGVFIISPEDDIKLQRLFARYGIERSSVDVGMSGTSPRMGSF